jgi:hypothetical protein
VVIPRSTLARWFPSGPFRDAAQEIADGFDACLNGPDRLSSASARGGAPTVAGNRSATRPLLNDLAGMIAFADGVQAVGGSYSRVLRRRVIDRGRS